MTIDQAYTFIQTTLNKNQQGLITPVQFNNMAPIAQLSVLNQVIGNDLTGIDDMGLNKAGMSLPKNGFGLNQKTQEIIRNLIVPPVSITFTGGVGTYPADGLYIFDMGLPDGTEVLPIEIDELRILNKSVIKPPTTEYPRRYQLSGNMYIVPTTITSAFVSYVRRPLVPFWNSTIVNSAPVYNPTGSQDFELGDFLHLKVCQRMLQYFGLNLGLDDIVAAVSGMERQGQ